MQKIVFLMLLIVFTFVFAACSNGNNNVSVACDNYSDGEQAQDNYEDETVNNYGSGELAILDMEILVPYISDFGFRAVEDFLFNNYLQIFTYPLEIEICAEKAWDNLVWEYFYEIGTFFAGTFSLFAIDDSGIPGITIRFHDAGSTVLASYKFIDGHYQRIGLFSFAEWYKDGTTTQLQPLLDLANSISDSINQKLVLSVICS